MPLVKSIADARLVFIDTEIGRGHPGYLDGTMAPVAAICPELPLYRTDVFGASRGLARVGWRGVRWLYRVGSRGGLVTSLYNRLRESSSGGSDGGPAMVVLGRDIRRLASRARGIVVVSHPLLAQMLAPVAPVVYQHGELAAPSEAIVKGCRKILVPWPETAARFEQGGLPAETLVVTGQCIEPELVGLAEMSQQARIERLSGGGPLTAAFFTSGAYPPMHIRRLLLAVRSFVAAGQKAVVFCGRSESVAGRMITWLRRQGLSPEKGTGGSAEIRIVVSQTREEESQRTAALFPELDLFIAPAHERTNWAVGLGLPLFILGPHIGSYAPLNAAIALDRQVAVELGDDRSAEGMGDLIADLRRSGRLATMAVKGFGRTAIDGFDISARLLVEMVSNGAADGRG